MRKAWNILCLSSHLFFICRQKLHRCLRGWISVRPIKHRGQSDCAVKSDLTISGQASCLSKFSLASQLNAGRSNFVCMSDTGNAWMDAIALLSSQTMNC